MVNKKKFWTKQKVLVTGAAGFVGSRLTKKLLSLGAEVIAITLNSRDKILDVALENKERLTVETCDLIDYPAVLRLFEKRQISTVFHLAASAIVARAAINPWPTVQNNVQATLNILEACRLRKVIRILLASSDKVYGDHAKDELEGLPYQESYALRGLDIYSASKVAADTLAQAYAFQYKIPIAVIRFCNIYGPGDRNFTRLIPKVSMQLLSGSRPIIYSGHENVLREYLYIDDAVRAYLSLAEKIVDYYGPNARNMPAKGKKTYGWLAFNAGSYSNEQTKKIETCENIKNVTQVISALCQKIADIAPSIVQNPPQYIEIPDEYFNSSKILNLGFRPEMGFSEGLDKTVKWYKENFESLKDNYQNMLA